MRQHPGMTANRRLSVVLATVVAGIGGFFVGRAYERDSSNDGTFPIQFEN